MKRYKLSELEKALTEKNYEWLEEIAEVEVDKCEQGTYIDFRIYVNENEQGIDYVELHGDYDSEMFEDETYYYISRNDQKFRKYKIEGEEI